MQIFAYIFYILSVINKREADDATDRKINKRGKRL